MSDPSKTILFHPQAVREFEALNQEPRQQTLTDLNMFMALAAEGKPHPRVKSGALQADRPGVCSLSKHAKDYDLRVYFIRVHEGVCVLHIEPAKRRNGMTNGAIVKVKERHKDIVTALTIPANVPTLQLIPSGEQPPAEEKHEGPNTAVIADNGVILVESKQRLPRGWSTANAIMLIATSAGRDTWCTVQQVLAQRQSSSYAETLHALHRWQMLEYRDAEHIRLTDLGWQVANNMPTRVRVQEHTNGTTTIHWYRDDREGSAPRTLADDVLDVLTAPTAGHAGLTQQEIFTQLLQDATLNISESGSLTTALRTLVKSGIARKHDSGDRRPKYTLVSESDATPTTAPQPPVQVTRKEAPMTPLTEITQLAASSTANKPEETQRQTLIRMADAFSSALGAALGTLARDERRQGLDVLDALEDFCRNLRMAEKADGEKETR